MSSSIGADPLESTGDRGFIDRSPNKDRTQNRGDYPILGPSEWAEIKDRRFFEVKGLLIPKPRTSPLPEDVVSEETQARIEEALQRTRNHRLRQ